MQMSKSVVVIGIGVRAAQCALTLAEMGIEVALITPSPSLDLDRANTGAEPSHESLHAWPLLLRATNHPRVKLYTQSSVKSVLDKSGRMLLKILKEPRYVKEELCTGCGKCEESCSVRVQTQVNGRKVNYGAIHSPILGAKSIPSAYYIEKEGISPCRANCPLGINVQAYVALIGKGKVDKALALINDIAPMAGILGRLCTHPCETHCSRGKVDNPVYIQSLHRFAADSHPGAIEYKRKAPADLYREKIAIIGSGPAGLTAAWELARRGYSPTIFEAHAVVGGMLATGIPRFRLPREIREKEVEAIKALGVDMKTGITVGRDVMYVDLLDRGYKAFFLAIGAQQNNKLNIPGEDLNGVMDCVSLLFSLNSKIGASVGSEVIVVGGGNSAVDSARSARRVSKGDVRILCLTDKMTAVKEDVDEAVNEGIIIDYNVTVTEILGDVDNVTGVRCQRVKNVTFEPDGKINMEVLPDGQFELKADRVVVAIGQRPNAPALNIRNLKLGRNSTIVADPLTLETSIPGIFAGGDAVTGSNNVVSAMSAGLRVAESIDRFIRGRDPRKGRDLEAPTPVNINIEERKVSPHKRSHMITLPLSRRKGNYEETNLGLTEALALRETERCLNCAVCCECLECVQTCELHAVDHQDIAKNLEIEADSIINMISPAQNILEIKKPGVYNIDYPGDGSLSSYLAQVSAVALSVAIDLKLKETPETEVKKTPASRTVPALAGAGNNTAVFLCRCGDAISSVVDFNKVTRKVAALPDVHTVQELVQSCTQEGALKIRSYVEKEKIAHVVLAACRCCNLEQICFSCTDRRVMCQNNLLLDLPLGVNVEFANIREQCAWVHHDDKDGATQKAIELISTGVARAQKLMPAVYTARPVTGSVLVISTGIAGLAAVDKLAYESYGVTLISDVLESNSGKLPDEYRKNQEKIIQDLVQRGIKINPWPEFMELNGDPGRYEAKLKYGTQTQHIKSGAVILDILCGRKESVHVLNNSNLISRVTARQHHFSKVSSLDSTLLHSYTVRETAGIFIVVPVGVPSSEEQITLGQLAAARASVYLNQGSFKPRSSAVIINPDLCRGCGDCSHLCQHIEIKTGDQGKPYAYIDPALCFGCGACMSTCPTGAITQPLQSEVGLVAALENLLKSKSVSES